MDKYEFIAELLKRKHLRIDQREKILSLTAKEIDSDKSEFKILKDRMDSLEERLNPLTEPLNPESKNPDYINPSQLSKFLSHFNDDSILLTTTHEIDEDELSNLLSEFKKNRYDFNEHRRLISSRYWKLKTTYKGVSRKMIGLIDSYLLGKKGKNDSSLWSSDNIPINWSCDELIEWSNKNPGIPPNPDIKLAQQLHTPGFRFKTIKSSRGLIGSMSELTGYFKNLIRINANNNITDILQSVNKKFDWEDILDFDFDGDNIDNNTELFTDVDKLKQTYGRIIEIIIEERAKDTDEKDRVVVSFKDHVDKCVLSIHHTNSVFRKQPHNIVERNGQKIKNLIKNQIVGLCDFHLNADFGNGRYARINLWDENKMTEESIPEFKGVEYILIFKR